MNKSLMLLFLLASTTHAAWFVATDGSDLNRGSLEQPFKTISKAVIAAAPGDTIYIRAGTHALTTTINISSSKNGNDTLRFYLWGYPGERPLLDFSAQSFGGRGISLKAGWWYLKDLDLRGAGDNGLYLDGTAAAHNIVENCAFFENRDSGVQLDHGAHDNLFINCDSYYNADPPDYGDADGFAPKLTVGSGNSFYGCRAWGNCDDGWDGYMRGATDVTTTLEECWTWGNGWLKDGTNPGDQANGNGFKMGGGDNSNSEMLTHHFILSRCLAFNNKGKGFDQNNNAGSMSLDNCSGYGNQVANYRITRALAAGQTLTLRNCLSFNGDAEIVAFAVQSTNSWLSPFVVTEADFISLDPALASAPRKADGSLPDMPFLYLAPGSDLINAGTDIGLPFIGSAPDLGAFEATYLTTADLASPRPAIFQLEPNYPNPFNPATTISYSLTTATRIRLVIYNLHGQTVAILAEGFQPAGVHRVTWRPDGLASGIYICRLEAGTVSQTRRLLLAR